MILCSWTEKGGAGKTTTAVALASGAALRGRCVLLDLDPQKNATDWLLGGLVEETALTAVDVLAGRATVEEAAIAVPGIANLSVVPATRRLTSIEAELAESAVPQLALKTALGALADDVTVVIDLPPAYGLLSVAGLIAADCHVIPVRPSALDGRAVSETVRLADEVRQAINPDLRLAAFVITAFDERETFGHVLFDGLTQLYDSVPVVKVPARAVVKMAAGAGETLQEFAPTSPATIAYKDLATTLFGVVA